MALEEYSKVEIELAVTAPLAREQIPGLKEVAEHEADEVDLFLEYGLGREALSVLNADARQHFGEAKRVRLRRYEGDHGDVVFATKGSQRDGRKDGVFKLSARQEIDHKVDDNSVNDLAEVGFSGGLKEFLFRLSDHVQAVTLRQRFYFDGELRREIGEILDIPSEYAPFCHLDIIDGPVENGVLIKIDFEFPDAVCQLEPEQVKRFTDVLWTKRNEITRAFEKFLGVKALNFSLPEGVSRPSKTNVGREQWRRLKGMRGDTATKAANIISLPTAMIDHGDDLNALRIRKPF